MANNTNAAKTVLLVLGKGRAYDGLPSIFTRVNVEKAVQLDRDNPGAYDAVVFPARWCGPDSMYAKTEAQVMMEYAVSLGMNPAKVVLEQEAQDTLGTFYYIDKILDGMKDLRKVVVVAADYHMARTQFIARKFFSGRYDLEFHGADQRLPVGNEFRLLMDDEAVRLKREYTEYGMIRDGDNKGMARRIETLHGLYSKKEVQIEAVTSLLRDVCRKAEKIGLPKDAQVSRVRQ